MILLNCSSLDVCRQKIVASPKRCRRPTLHEAGMGWSVPNGTRQFNRPAEISSSISLSHSWDNLEEIQSAMINFSSRGSCSIAASISWTVLMRDYYTFAGESAIFSCSTSRSPASHCGRRVDLACLRSSHSLLPLKEPRCGWFACTD